MNYSESDWDIWAYSISGNVSEPKTKKNTKNKENKENKEKIHVNFLKKSINYCCFLYRLESSAGK